MANPTDGDPRMTWGLIMDLLDVYERHGFRRVDDRHTGRQSATWAALAACMRASRTS